MMSNENNIPIIIPQAAPVDEFCGPEFRQFTEKSKTNMSKSKQTSQCTSCGKQVSLFLIEDALTSHPVLSVLMCKHCFNFYHSGSFTQDELGIDEQCLWCGEGGNLIMCDFCTRAFCNYCIKRNFSHKDFTRIRDMSEWRCFVCNKGSLRSKQMLCSEVLKKQQQYFKERSEFNQSHRDTFPNCLSEINHDIDEIIIPLEANEPVHNGKISNENDSCFMRKKVTPITIMKEKENYIVRSKSKSPTRSKSPGLKVKLVMKSLSDTETQNEKVKNSACDNTVYFRAKETNSAVVGVNPSSQNLSFVGQEMKEKVVIEPFITRHEIPVQGTIIDDVRQVKTSSSDSNSTAATENKKTAQENDNEGVPDVIKPFIVLENVSIDDDTIGLSGEHHVPATTENRETAEINGIEPAREWSGEEMEGEELNAFQKIDEVARSDEGLKDLDISAPKSPVSDDINHKGRATKTRSARDSDFELDSTDEIYSDSVLESLSSSTTSSDFVTKIKRLNSSSSNEESDLGPWVLPLTVDGGSERKRRKPKQMLHKNINGEHSSSPHSDVEMQEKADLYEPDLSHNLETRNDLMSSKIAEAKLQLGRLTNIFSELNFSQNSFSPQAQYSQFKTTCSLLKTVRSFQTVLRKVETDLLTRKKSLAKSRVCTSDSEDGSSESGMESTPKNLSHKRSWRQHKLSLSSNRSSISPEKPHSSIQEVDGHVEKREKSTSQDVDAERGMAMSEEEKEAARETTNLYEARVLLKKLTREDILKFSTAIGSSDFSDQQGAGSLDTDSSKATFRSSRRGSKEDLSESSEGLEQYEARMKRLCTPSFSNKDCNKNNIGTKKVGKEAKIRKTKIQIDDSDDYFSSEEYSEFSDFADDLGMPNMPKMTLKKRNDIALDMLLKKIEVEKDDSNTDSDVDDLINDQMKTKSKPKKQEGASVTSAKEKVEKSDDNSGDAISHPLLNKKWKSPTTGKQEKLDSNANKRKISDCEGIAPISKKTRRKLNLRDDDDVNSSTDEWTTDTDDDDILGKKKGKLKELDSESNSDHEIEESSKKRRGSDELESEDVKPIYKIFQKKKRKRIIISDSDEEDKVKTEKDLDITDSPFKQGRRNIRKILDDEDVSMSTKEASQQEMERRRRLERNQESEEENKEVIFIDEDKEGASVKVVKCLKLSKDPLVEVDPELIRVLKPHQIDGVRFMWNNLIERVQDTYDRKPGNGCIVAHCMGLGKTLQTVTFLHTVLMSTHLPSLKTSLILCPYGTINNWEQEFHKWLKKCKKDPVLNKFNKLPVFNLASVKSHERADKLRRWKELGGVMVMGYGLFRSLVDEKKRHTRSTRILFDESLTHPGPDILICDEGHILKNAMSAIAQVVQKLKTRRRIILTGTPLQNNMVEYHCMVSVVKPRLLGTLKEFKNRFINPIENGQHVDSTETDVKLMKKRAHVLHELLAGCVQRKDYTCLRSHLLPKFEFVLSIRLSDLQIRMYERYLSMHTSAAVRLKGACLFNDFNKLLLLVCHPRCLILEKERMQAGRVSKDISRSDADNSEESDGDSSDDSIVVISDSDPETTEPCIPATEEDLEALSKRKLRIFIEKQSGHRALTKNHKKLIDLATKYLEKNYCNTDEYYDSLKLKPVQQLKKIIKDNGGTFVGCTEKSDLISRIRTLKQSQVDEEWYEKLMPTQENLVRANMYSGKIVIMLEILHGATKVGDKVVIFSQSLLTLDLIEDVLKAETQDVCKGLLPKIEPFSKWFKGMDYYRLDGSTPGHLRDTWIRDFNDPNQARGRVFLISTRAGGIGINLVGANRAIVFDASWNPTHDVQSIFRIYRFGQTKPCYVYRLIAQGTMEEKIYERQVVKQSLAFRVVDEQQIVRHFRLSDVTELYSFKPAPKPVIKRDENGTEIPEDTPKCAPPRDSILASIVKSTATRDHIVSFHEHDSLLDHQVSEELTDEERRIAWEEYDQERKIREQPALDPRSPFANISISYIMSFIKKADEALEAIKGKLTHIQDKNFLQIMAEIQLKHRVITVTAASKLALQRMLENHLLRCRLTNLHKFFLSKKEEMMRWCSLKKMVGPANSVRPTGGVPVVTVNQANNSNCFPFPMYQSSVRPPGSVYSQASTSFTQAHPPSRFRQSSFSSRGTPNPRVPYPYANVQRPNSNLRGTQSNYTRFRVPQHQGTRPRF